MHRPERNENVTDTQRRSNDTAPYSAISLAGMYVLVVMKVRVVLLFSR